MDNTPAMHTLFDSIGPGSAAMEIALQLGAVPYRTVHASSWEALAHEGVRQGARAQLHEDHLEAHDSTAPLFRAHWTS